MIAPRRVNPLETKPMLIRMFPDWFGGVLWLLDLLKYEETGLSQELIDDLDTWEQSYYDSLTEDVEFKTPELASRFMAMGNVLAQRVANEVGPDYVIELSNYEEGINNRRFHVQGPAQNPGAAVAFAVLANALTDNEIDLIHAVDGSDGEDQTGWNDGLDEGATGNDAPQWFAYSPLSGEAYEPGSAAQ